MSLDVYKNTWILWSAGMEEPVEVEKVCSQVDILPTFSIFWAQNMTPGCWRALMCCLTRKGWRSFFSRSWITDQGTYSRYTEEFQPAPDVEMTEEEKNVYVENKKYLADCVCGWEN